jgi:hypothetical protein
MKALAASIFLGIGVAVLGCGSTPQPRVLKGKGLLVDFPRWTVNEGQDSVQRLFYARLPEDLARRSNRMSDRIKVSK